VWQPGHWQWNGYDYAWMEGRWLQRRPARAQWQPGQWVDVGGRWEWQPPGWR
jgi:hypothetical protein